MNRPQLMNTKQIYNFFFGLAVVCIGFFIFYRFNPEYIGIYPVCPFHRLTGLYCPGCGSTRATYWLLHGDVMKALKYNALYVIILPFLAIFVLNTFVKMLVGKELIKTPSISGTLLWIVVILVFAFGILRNLPIKPFDLLAP